MALFLWLLGAGAVFMSIWGPHYDPRYDSDRSFNFSKMLAEISPSAENLYSRATGVLSGLAFIAGGVFILGYYWGQ